MHAINQDLGCVGYQQLTRRRLFQTTVATGAATWLTQFAETLARAADKGSHRPKSLLMIWLQGGPSQLETFDPHVGSWIGGDVQSVDASIPGVRLADTLPATAEQLHLATLVRSVVSKEGDHERATYHLKTGWRPDPTIVHPSIGAVVCRQTQENLEIPRHVSILPGQWPARGGYLGPGLDAFQIGDPAEPIPNLRGRVSDERMDQRRGPLLDAIETEFARGRLVDMDAQRTLHRQATERAASMMSSEQLSAFDVHLEPTAVLERFGDSAFGRGCLAAVRLLSSGVRCVEVELDGWDSHINNHELQTSNASVLDRALASTLQELDERDMLDDTVVFCGGEFGRTPIVNPASGRDHWPHGFSVVLAGGRFRRGFAYGETAANPDREQLESESGSSLDISALVRQPVTVPDLHATLLHALGIDHEEEMMTPIGRPLRWSDGAIVPELIDV